MPRSVKVTAKACVLKGVEEGGVFDVERREDVEERECSDGGNICTNPIDFNPCTLEDYQYHANEGVM